MKFILESGHTCLLSPGFKTKGLHIVFGGNSFRTNERELIFSSLFIFKNLNIYKSKKKITYW